MVTVELIYNLALLVALSVVSGFIDLRWSRNTRLGALLQGALFGGTAVIAMLRPLTLGPGLIFDGRSVVISLGALFFGPWCAVVAGAMTITLRLILGGSGAVMGVSVILASAFIGVFYHRRHQSLIFEFHSLQLWLFGLLVHLVMLALTFTLPDIAAFSVLQLIGWPVILTYPLATVLIGKILSDQATHGRFLADLKNSEERFGAFMNQLPALCVLKDDQGRVLFTNDHMNAMLNAQHWVGHTAREYLPDAQAGRMMAEDRRILERGIPEVEEVTLEVVTGENRIFEAHRFPIKRQGKSDILGTIAIDITARRQAEDQLRRSLQEKEVLLREVHHRVKNNLNIMTSLLRLQASTIRTPEQALLAMQNTRDRILSMALVHEELYRSRDYAQVDMQAYLDMLARQLLRAYGPGDAIRLTTRAQGVVLSIDRSIPCGLILNELMTNALKHAFPHGGPGEIRVEMREAGDGEIELSVADTGIGVPADSEGRGTLGLTLVRLLCEQLEGTLTITNDSGTRYHIRFPSGGGE
jgi:PAS domain S-box-containing protein